MSVDVRIDREKCKGYGKCAQIAPDTFALDTDKVVTVRAQGASGEDLLVRAAKSCPYRVITVTSDAAGQIFPLLRKPS